MGTRQSALGAARAPGAVLALFVAAAAVLAVASVAYACTGRANLYDVSPASAKPGATVTVKGENYHPDDVEIRWNDADGELLAVAQGPNFSKKVTIPADADPGGHAIVGIAYNQVTDQTVGRDAHAFKVERVNDSPQDHSGDGSQDSDGDGDPATEDSDGNGEPSENSTSGDPSGDSSEEPSSQNSSSGDPSSQDSTSQDSTSQDSTSQDSTSQEPTSHDATSQEPSSQDSTSQEPTSQDSTSQEPTSQDSTSQEPSSNGSRESAGSDAPESSQQPQGESQQDQGGASSDPASSGSESSGQVNVTEPTAEDGDVAGEETAAEPALGSEDEATPATAPEAGQAEPRGWDSGESSADHPGEPSSPSDRTGSQDLWDGVASGDALGQAPGLEEPPAEGEFAGAGQHLAVAAGLLGAGLLLLTGGLLVATVRRRPAKAATHAQHG